MPATTKLALPYPAATDPADIPIDMQELADRIDTVTGTASGLASLGADGKVPAAQLPTPAALLPRELGYAQNTAVVTITGASEAAAQVLVTAPSVTFDGSTIVRVEFFSELVRPPAVAAASITLWLYDGAASIGAIGSIFSATAQQVGGPVMVARRLTPSAAAHVYSVRASVSSGTGSVVGGVGGAGQDSPMFVAITRV